MQTTITIFKHDLKDEPLVIKMLADHATEVRETNEAFFFVPVPGKLFDLLQVLRDHKVAYGMQYDWN